MRRFVFFVLIAGVVFCQTVAAQSHSSVPVEEKQIYRFLEMAQIRGLTERLPSVRPYPRSLIARALKQINSSRADLPVLQRKVLDYYMDRYVKDEDKPLLQDGDLRVDHPQFPFQAGAYMSHESRVDLKSPKDWGTHNIFGVKTRGDIGKHVSYGFNLELSLNKVVWKEGDPYPYAWAPYTYTKVWDGGARPLRRFSSFNLMPREVSIGISMNAEIAGSFLDNKININVARHRRDWGSGEGNLLLDKQARPFVGVGGTFSPWNWMNFSFLYGALEYGTLFRDTKQLNIKDTAKVQQNLFSLYLLEIAPFPWLDISLYDAVVYLSRFEPGYMLPIMSKILYQNNSGDFDNLMFGGTLGLSWPGLVRVYASGYFDEWNPFINWNALRNQGAFQFGAKTALPLPVWSLITVQYTKLEPFVYTHYVVKNSPWYEGLSMETGYQSNGENLGSYLEPNSDELLLGIHVQPAAGWTANFSYRLIRHGKPSSVIGSTYKAWGEGVDKPDDDPKGAYGGASKNFLKDGIYEWFHVFSLGAELDLRTKSVPVTVGLNYSFVYSFETDYGSFGDFRIKSGTVQTRHLAGLNVRIWM